MRRIAAVAWQRRAAVLVVYVVLVGGFMLVWFWLYADVLMPDPRWA